MAILENRALACENIGALGGTRTPNLLTRSEVPAIQHVRLSPAGSRFRRPGAHRRPGRLAVSSRSGGVCVTDVTRQRPGEDLRPAGQRSAWEITAMPAIPQVTPRTVHEVCEETGAPAAASAGQSDPDCCTGVIYLHTAVHRLWLTSPGVYTDVCGHRRACTDALLLGWRALASRGTHTDRAAGGGNVPRSRARACARSVGMPLDGLQYCSGNCSTVLLQSLRARKQHFGLERGLHTAAEHAAVIQ